MNRNGEVLEDIGGEVFLVENWMHQQDVENGSSVDLRVHAARIGYFFPDQIMAEISIDLISQFPWECENTGSGGWVAFHFGGTVRWQGPIDGRGARVCLHTQITKQSKCITPVVSCGRWWSYTSTLGLVVVKNRGGYCSPLCLHPLLSVINTHCAPQHSFLYLISCASTMAPHFLTIPREIRDEIYSYLSAEIDVPVNLPRHPVDEANPNHPIANICHNAYIDNAPLVNVLLINSQVRDEYLEAACFTKVRMGFGIYLYGEPWDDARLDTTLLEGDLMNVMKTALGKAQEITILSDIEYNHPDLHWSSVIEVIAALQPYMLNVSTMRILASEANQARFGDEPADIVQQMKQQDMALASGRGYVYLSPPPAKLIGLPLRQCAQGYTYKCYVHSPVLRIIMADASGAWVFAKEKMNTPWVQPSEMMDRWPIETWPEDLVESISKLDKKMARILEKRIIWDERRGDDVYAWGVREENAGTGGDM